MNAKAIFILVIIFVQMVFCCQFPQLSAGEEPESEIGKVITFYYPWYGNPEADGEYFHWNHQVMDKSGKSFPGGDDIGANYYPMLGCYSCNDPATVEQHMKWMQDAGIDIISSSWWGFDTFENKATPLLLDKADEYGLKVCFHIEPFDNRSADTMKAAIIYIIDEYGDHPAFYRDEVRGNRPLFFMYDSYQISPDEWQSLLTPDGSRTIRNTEYDSIVIALLVEPMDQLRIINSNFDGCYSYFGIDNFTFGSNSSKWEIITKWAKDNGRLFVPCPGPGYIDTRIRPWNTANTRHRENGDYYKKMFTAAILAKPEYIGISTFNEWHEGTQIEPAIHKSIDDFVYLDYSPQKPDYYIEQTGYYADLYRRYISGEITELPYDVENISSGPFMHEAYNCDLKYVNQPSMQYTGGSSKAIVDGYFGSDNYRDGSWVGFEKDDLDVTLILKKTVEIHEISFSFLEDHDAWIFFPDNVRVEYSLDAENWKPFGSKPYTEQPGQTKNYIFGKSKVKMPSNKKVNARYIRVFANNIRVCPDWHYASGGKAWLFVDEIVVN